MDIDEAKFAKGHLAAELLEKSLEKVVEVAKELTEKFVENITEAIEFGDQVEKTSQSLGVQTEALQELLFVGKLVDISTEEMSTSLKFLARNMDHARQGSEEQAKAFHRLGIKVTDAHGKIRSVDEVMGDVAEKFGPGGMKDGVEKTALAVQLFGRAGQTMIPMLNKGREGLAEMREEAHALGFVMSEDSVKAAGELDENIKRLRMTAQGLWRGAVAPLLPAINELVKRFLAWRQANAKVMADKLRSFISLLITGIEKLADVFSFLERNAKAVYAILGTAGLVGAMYMLGSVSVATAIRVGAAWALAALPFVAIAAAIAAILLVYDDLRTYNEDEAKHSKKQHSLYGVMKQRIDELYKDRPKPPFLVHFIEFVEALRHTGEYLSQLKRDFTDFYDVIAPRVAAFYHIMRAADNGDTAELSKGLALLAQIQANDKVAVSSGGINSGGAYAPGITPTWRTPAGGSSYSTSHNTLAPVIQVYQQPGESSDNFVERVGQHVENIWDRKMEEANAGVLR